MSKGTLYNKVWDAHVVDKLPTGQYQLFIGLHLIHEVTSPQAFDMIAEKGLKVAYPQRTFATVDHIVPTQSQARPFQDGEAEQMMGAIEKNVKKFGVSFFDFKSGNQGIVHIIGPEMGLTQPGMTIACGDSHTSTHGAFGTLAFGIGTTQVRDVLATQCLAMDALKVRRINVNGKLKPGSHRQGRHPLYHPEARGQGRHRLRLRVRRKRVRRYDHGRAHDRLQHGHRGRRPHRLREPGPDHL